MQKSPAGWILKEAMKYMQREGRYGEAPLGVCHVVAGDFPASTERKEVEKGTRAILVAQATQASDCNSGAAIAKHSMMQQIPKLMLTLKKGKSGNKGAGKQRLNPTDSTGKVMKCSICGAESPQMVF